jgi:hypothetical protein
MEKRVERGLLTGPLEVHAADMWRNDTWWWCVRGGGGGAVKLMVLFTAPTLPERSAGFYANRKHLRVRKVQTRTE